MHDVCALVLAAGAGRRFGGRKMLAPWRGQPLVTAALAAAFAAPARQVLLVTGADGAEVTDATRLWAERSGGAERLRIVPAERHLEGISASLKAGLAALPADCTACFVFLGDMPAIPPDIAGRLALLLEDERVEAAAPLHQGQRGHPVLLRASLFGRFAHLSGDAGAGALLAGLGPRLALLPVEDDGVLFDIDKPIANPPAQP